MKVTYDDKVHSYERGKQGVSLKKFSKNMGLIFQILDLQSVKVKRVRGQGRSFTTRNTETVREMF